MSSDRARGGRLRPARVAIVALRLATHRWPQTLGLVLAGMALAAPLVGLGAVRQSGLHAIEESVGAEFGYPHGWKLQATTSAAEAIRKSGGTTAVKVSAATVTTRSARLESPVWVVDNASAPLGVLVAGRRVRTPGEATVTTHVAEALAIDVGADVTVRGPEPGRPESYRIVGLISDPADRDDKLVVAWPTATAGDDADPTYWLMADVPPSLDATPGITATSVAGTITSRLDRAPGSLAAIGQAMPVVGLITLVTMLVGVAAQVPGARRDVDALLAAGLGQRAAWRVVGLWMAGAASVGALTGAAGAVLVVRVLADPASHALGQRWSEVAAPVPLIALLTGLALAAGTLPATVLGRGSGTLRHRRLPDSRLGRTAAVAGVVIGLVGLGAITIVVGAADGKPDLGHPEILGLGGLLATALGARSLVELAVGLRRRPASRALAERLAASLSAGVTAALLIGAACAGYAAWHTHNAHALEKLTISPQAPGSFLVFEAPAEAAANVLAQYWDSGGSHAFLFDLPDESQGSVRVTSAAVAQCLGTAASRPGRLDACLRSHGGILNTVALDRTLDHGVAVVEGDVRDDNGEAGLVRFSSDGRSVLGEVVAADADHDLGGNMPGLVVSPDGPVAREHGLKPSGLVEFGILDFGSLKPNVAAEIRQIVAETAPAAQVSDSTVESSQTQRLMVGLLVALVGAATASLVLLAAGVAAVAGSHRLRRAVAATGITPGQRIAITGRAVAPAMVGLLVSALLVPYLAPRVGIRHEGSIGWSWCLPLVLQAGMLLGLSIALLKPPRR